VNEIPLLGMPEEWYDFVISGGHTGNPPKNMEDADNIAKNYKGMYWI